MTASKCRHNLFQSEVKPSGDSTLGPKLQGKQCPSPKGAELIKEAFVSWEHTQAAREEDLAGVSCLNLAGITERASQVGSL